MVSDYVEELLAGNPRHATSTTLKTGVKRDGTLTAHQVRYTVNSGAYAAFKPRGLISGANEAAGPYRIPNCRIESAFVYTNTVPGGFMRAPGEPQGVFALESHLDVVARRIGMDPLDFRLKNLIVDGDATAFGESLEHIRACETLQAAADAAGYHNPKAPWVGRGVAIGERPSGGGVATAAITLHADGRVVVGTPIFDQGTDTYTTLTQVAAEELYVSPEAVEIEVWNTIACRLTLASPAAAPRASTPSSPTTRRSASKTRSSPWRRGSSNAAPRR
jgi:CO/xanthine dehydrogenase Mo-binding subunit